MPMKHLFTVAILSAVMATPAIADISVPLSRLKTSDIPSSFDAQKPSKNLSTRAEEDGMDWQSLGIGTYRDDVFTALYLPSASWKVEIMESATTPGCYKVVNPYGVEDCPYFGGKSFDGSDIIIHAENPETVYLEYTELKGVGIQDIDDSGNLVTYKAYLCDMGGYYVDMFSAWGMGLEDVVGMGIPFGTLKNGNITFQPGTILLDLPEIEQQLYANESGLFRITLPGAPDYDLSVTLEESCLENGDLHASCIAGADITSVKYMVLPGWKKDSYGSARESIMQDLKEHGTEVTDGEIKAQLPFGVHSLVTGAFNAEGDLVESNIMVCYGRTDDAANWKPLGKCEYNEAFLRYTYLDMECDPYQVEIEESTQTPGLYRLVNPYGEVYPKYDFFKENDYLAQHGGDHYLIVDASNPDRVMIEASPIGIEAEDGEAQLFSISWYAVQNGADPDDEEIVIDYGTLANGRITFPGGAIATYEQGYGITRGNLQHNFYIQLPGTTGVASIDNSKEATYFTISGTQVSQPTKGGIYIRRCGDLNTKVVIK